MIQPLFMLYGRHLCHWRLVIIHNPEHYAAGQAGTTFLVLDSSPSEADHGNLAKDIASLLIHLARLKGVNSTEGHTSLLKMVTVQVRTA
jgi:hypothetical protein